MKDQEIGGSQRARAHLARLTSATPDTVCSLRSLPRRAGGFFLLFSATSAGMFVSAPALLPSSSSMILFMLVMAMWLNGRFALAVRYGLSAPPLIRQYHAGAIFESSSGVVRCFLSPMRGQAFTCRCIGSAASCNCMELRCVCFGHEAAIAFIGGRHRYAVQRAIVPAALSACDSPCLVLR